MEVCFNSNLLSALRFVFVITNIISMGKDISHGIMNEQLFPFFKPVGIRYFSFSVRT